MYQGGELWDHSLVDPDNRRPVDYDLRRSMLAELQSRSPRDAAQYALQHFDEGSPKLWVVTQALRLRLERHTSFDAVGTYTPVLAEGSRADHVVAYKRGDDVLVVAPRLPHRLANNWSTTTIQIPAGRWTDRLSGQVYEGGSAVRVAALLDHFPVALLVQDSERTQGNDVRGPVQASVS
jgi:(1->4)-alpha-D-glucan 1-alpha-D-glucosylmutase